MGDFFDDIDPEDVAFWGGLADEFAEQQREERRQQAGRLWNEADEVDLDEDGAGHPYSQPRGSRVARRKPFEQFAWDVARGIKHHHDPLLGPTQTRRGPGANPRHRTEAVVYGVRVINAHMVAESFLRFIYTALCGHPENEVAVIEFAPEGRPVADGVEDFAVYDAGARSIVINMQRLFENAMRIVQHNVYGYGMYALIWSNLVFVFLHELKHALDHYANPEAPFEMRAEQEALADRWASEARTWFARQGYCEMPPVAEDPYLGRLVTDHLNGMLACLQPRWAVRQIELVEAGVYYRNEAEGFDIRSMQEFYELSWRGLDGEPRGRVLNACVQRENEKEAALWHREEMTEAALREAVAGKRRVLLEIVDYQERRLSLTFVPEDVYSMSGFMWTRGIVEQTGKKADLQLDRIENVVFQV